MEKSLSLSILCIIVCIGIANADLIGHWKLDETSGQTAYDSAGTHNGSLINYTTNSWTSGQIDGALAFDGSNDYVNMGSVDAYENLENITISAWINLTQVVSDRHFIFGQEFLFKIDLDHQKPRFLLGSDWDDWSGNALTSTTTLSTGRWYHIAATYDGQYKRIYINGQNTDSLNAPIVGDIGSSDFDVTIGSHYSTVDGYTKFFKGYIDDVRIYNNALTGTEIQAIMVPEPATIIMMGLAGIGILRRKKA